MKTRKLLIYFTIIIFFGNVSAYTIAIGGELKINGDLAPTGTEIIAKVDDYELKKIRTEKEGAYVLTIDDAENYLYKQVDLYVAGIKIKDKIFLKTDKYENLDIDLDLNEISTSTTKKKVKAVKNKKVTSEVGLIGRITDYSASNYATILGIVLVLILIIATLKEKKDDS